MWAPGAVALLAQPALGEPPQPVAACVGQQLWRRAHLQLARGPVHACASGLQTTVVDAGRR